MQLNLKIQEVNPHAYEHLILAKKPKLYNGEKKAPSTNDAGPTGFLVCRKMKIDPYLSLCTKLKSKWIKDLNIKTDSPKKKWRKALNTLS